VPGGIETAPDHPLGDFPARKWQAIEGCLPKEMTGWRVLNVGCNAGFYSFVLAESGARVFGVDWDWPAAWRKYSAPPEHRRWKRPRRTYRAAKCVAEDR
jgi:SAM-dependent methyltransferase